MQRWEYAILAMDAGGNMFQVGYSGPRKVANLDHPQRDFRAILGDWEVVSVARSADQHGGLEEKLYFKRPHEDQCFLKE